MALNSPGVQVSIIDQSQYLPASPGSTPLILVATALNKSTPAGNAIASGTLETNAEHLYLSTSQSDLVHAFGNPFFYKTADGTPIHGYELNEYGLLAAYSVLGISNSAYILRANIDLGQLVGTLVRPAGNPPDGTWWLDVTNSSWGIFQWNSVTGSFTNQVPYVCYASANTATLIGNRRYPQAYIGSIGQFAVVVDEIMDQNSGATYFYKNYNNQWVELGSANWLASIPTIQATVSNPLLTTGDSFTINVNGNYTRSVQIPSTPNNTATGVAGIINGWNDEQLRARIDNNGRLVISYSGIGTQVFLSVQDTVNSPLAALGIVNNSTYYAPQVSYGDSNQMPLWGVGQQFPHPTGSVWIKTSISGTGIDVVVKEFSVATNSWQTFPVDVYTNTWAAIADLDPTGGKAIKAGTLLMTTGGNNLANANATILYERKTSSVPVNAAIGAYKSGYVSEVFGTQVLPTLSIGKTLKIAVSIPNSTSLNTYVLTVGAIDLYSFVSTWQSLNIVNTVINVSSTGVIYIRHTQGGDIFLSDYTNHGGSNGLIEELGLDTYSNSNTYHGPALTAIFQGVAQASTTGSGTGATFNVTLEFDHYIFSLVSPGSGYSVGDTITIAGTSIGGETTANDLIVNVQTIGVSGAITGIGFVSGVSKILYPTVISGWMPLTYEPNSNAPAALPLDGTHWYYSTLSNVDIMVNQGGIWKGYQNCAYDLNGHPIFGGSNATDPNGPIIAAGTPPTTQSDGMTDLAYGDLWIDSGDLENYPALYRWQSVSGIKQWVKINNGDAVSSSGIVFADARWGIGSLLSGLYTTPDPILAPIPVASSMLTSNYVDPDAPAADMYPQGVLLFNMRLSGYNVKKFATNYFTAANFGTGVPLPQYSYTWMNASGNNETGAAYMGRKSQRHMVVMALKSAINTNTQIREEDTFFNLIVCPGYPELQPDMVTLNNDRNQTAFIIGDTPLRLASDGNSLVDWANNNALATSSGEDGLVTRDTYLGVFYPSGITTDLSGADAVVPASHMMLHTMINNDIIAHPWFAPAGTQRGLISNASNIGYIDAKTGLFKVIKTRQSIRDVLYEHQINPLTFFTGIGLLNYGNKSSFASQSALDRINVARLIAYIRYNLQIAARPFVFQPNDSLTRSQLTGVVQSLFVGLVAQRGLYDYLVVCDASNNTPARVDANELWVDIAIEPTIAAEFIYIPVRVLATGGIAKLK